MHSSTRGILWMITSCFWAAVMISLVRHVATLEFHAFEIVFYRNGIALVLLLPWLIRAGGITVLRTTRLKFYALRTVIGLIAMLSWFYAITLIPLADATALSFTAPLFTALLAVIFFGETIGRYRISALIIGFFGTLIVLRPGTAVFDPNSLFVLVAACFWAGSSVLIKTLTNTDSPRVVVFYMVALMTPLSLPFALPYLHIFPLEHGLWLIVLALVSNWFQISLSNAISATEITVILPYDFLRLVFVAILATFLFDEQLDFWTFIGAGIIMASAVYTAYRERKRRLEA